MTKPHPPPEQPEPTRPGLPPPQFRLSTLLWVVALLSVLFAVMATLGPLGAFTLLLFALSVAGHVLGNSIGTQLREIGNKPQPKDEPAKNSPRGRGVKGHEFAPATSLRERTSVTRAMIALTVTTSTLAALVAPGVLYWLTSGESNLPTFALAIVSAAVLGGLLGFAASSLVSTARGAWNQARKNQ